MQQINLTDYLYSLPDEKIAKYPLPVRDSSKLLVYNQGQVEESVFSNVPDFIPGNSLVIFNNTKVIHARLIFRRETGARIEIFCLEPNSPNDYQLNFSQNEDCTWVCLVGNLKRWKEPFLLQELIIDGKKILLKAEKVKPDGNYILVRFSWNNADYTFATILEQFGQIPIPPYLNRESEESDSANYQTIYSKIEGSVAAPTAGLHFTDSVFDEFRQKNIDRENVTLHVGAGTFKPVQSDDATLHQMHTEHFSVPGHVIEKIIANAGNITAIGTTTARTLESLYWFGVKAYLKGLSPPFHLNQWEAYSQRKDIGLAESLKALLNFLKKNKYSHFNASTQIMIVPGYDFKIINRLITNFHQPGSTLLMMIAAFIGNDWKKVYKYALEHDFRFLSYGDSSILIPKNMGE